MNFFEKILYMLQAEMERPEPYGWFHLISIFLIIMSIIILYTQRKKYSEKQLKLVVGVYGIIALILETTQQTIRSFDYDMINNIASWDYPWYAAPFQLCTTPLYVSLICLFLKESKTRTALLSYMAYITIWGAFMAVIMPDNCFVDTILVNIYTVWQHGASLVLSIYLLMSGAVKLDKKHLGYAIQVFLIFVCIAELLNFGVYNFNIANGEEFNMFYISPYYISELPVFDTIQQNVPFPIFLFLYIFALSLGATIVLGIGKGIKHVGKKIKLNE